MNIKKFLTNIVATIMFSSLAISSITFFDKKIEVGAEELEVEIIENNSTEVTLKQENISDFVKNEHQILSSQEIFDFSGNKFLLYELCPAGYAIYSVKEDSSIFIEGSYYTNSPFFGYNIEQVKYLGFGNYLCCENNKYVNLVSGETYLQSDLPQSYELGESAYIVETENNNARTSYPSNPDPDETVNLNGFTMIENYQYFAGLYQFPSNTKGTCALVALCIMLGYLDNYVDDRFIPDNASYKDQLFKVGNGTTNAMHNYLFDECLHTILGLDDETGYPMACTEIKLTMRDYLNNKCGSDFEDEVEYVDGSVFFTHANPKKHINSGSPSIITMTSYYIENSDDEEKSKYHTVVAYGYDDNDRFLVHCGWRSGTTTWAKTIVSDATIYSYNTFSLK